MRVASADRLAAESHAETSLRTVYEKVNILPCERQSGTIRRARPWEGFSRRRDICSNGFMHSCRNRSAAVSFCDRNERINGSFIPDFYNKGEAAVYTPPIRHRFLGRRHLQARRNGLIKAYRMCKLSNFLHLYFRIMHEIRIIFLWFVDNIHMLRYNIEK